MVLNVLVTHLHYPSAQNDFRARTLLPDKHTPTDHRGGPSPSRSPAHLRLRIHSPLNCTLSLQMYGPRQVFVPKMPALGLLLEYPIFESYSRRIASVNAKLTPTDSEFRPAIDFEVHREQLDAFKDTHIYSKMRTIEDKFGM